MRRAGASKRQNAAAGSGQGHSNHNNHNNNINNSSNNKNNGLGGESWVTLESGQASSSTSTSTSSSSSSPNKQKMMNFQQRRKRGSKQISGVELILHRIRVFLNKRPENVRICIGFSLALGILASLTISALLHQSIITGETTPRVLSRMKMIDSTTTTTTTTTTTKNSVHKVLPSYEILIHTFDKKVSSDDEFKMPGRISYEDAKEGYQVDYGDLDIYFFEDEGAVRQIYHDFYDMETEYRLPGTSRDDDVEWYYAFDDDSERSDFITHYHPDYPEEDVDWCVRTPEHRLNFQNCNVFHEVHFIESKAKYLNEGAYRQVLSLDVPFGNTSETIVVKDIHFEYNFKHDHFEYVRIDALVAERLTASPRIYDIYGQCGLGILSEYFPHGDMEAEVVQGDGWMDPKDLHDEYEVKPQNNLTAVEKLTIALHMAEALADLHGYAGGIIVHQDLQLSQYLWTADKSRVKLNDFNRAEFMLWDVSRKKYCPYREGQGGGSWRAPEEYFDEPLDEKVDVFSFGNNMYSLLTGLWPFYDQEDDQDIVRRVRKGQTGFIDPRYKTRSKEEKLLCEIIEKCYKYNPTDRPSVFELVALLREGLGDISA